MIHAQNAKWFQLLAPISLNGAGTTLVIDCLGFDYLEIVVCLGLVGAADFTVLKIQESDVKASASTLTSGVDVTGLIFGTSTNLAGITSTFPGDANDGAVELLQIDLKARKRYLLLVVTTGIASLLGAIGRLSRPEQAPTTTGGTGAAQVPIPMSCCPEIDVLLYVS